MYKKFTSFAYVMTFLSQVAISFVIPFGLMWLVGYLLESKAGLGHRSLLICIVIGALLGVFSMFHYIITTVDWISKEDRRSSSNKKDTK